MKDAHSIELESIIELATLLAQQNDFQEILRLTTKKAADMMKAESASILMINPQTRHTIKTIHREGQNADEQMTHFIHTNISGWVIDNKSSFITPNLLKDKRFRRELFKKSSIHSVVCVPLKTECIIIGTLLLISEDESVFSDENLTNLEKLAAIVSPFLRNVQRIEQYFTSPILRENLRSKYEAHGLLGKSKEFIELLHSIEAAAHCDVRVLLEGKSGTGKELIAKAIHQSSDRFSCPFITIDCGAIPEHLMESELFGHMKGAFTGAATTRKGLFEEAHTGTLFMDEITNLPIDLQAKLLRVLQEGEIRPLGSNTTRKVNVRVITAASSSLKEMVQDKQFREDLFYRLMVYPIHIPSLEERSEDIPLLATHFMRIFSKQQNKEIENFHEEVIDFMKAHSWPGNIRELENFVERMVTLVPKGKKQIDIKLIPPEFKKEIEELRQSTELNKPLNESLADYEETLIRQALGDNNWNQSKAARALGISEQTIRYKMQKLGIEKS
ncbi:sigma-54-dependent Fis family transcriptional regulator [candidate division KSB1 bacterium]|nr:sigma-54-dependent Fis family transcriptional regulator [candidate division KSB1 bacterium]